MLFILDANNLVHAYYPIRTNEDRYDVTERVLQRLERLRSHFQSLYPDCSFVACFDNPKESFRQLLYPKYKSSRTHHEDLAEIIANVFEAVHNDADWFALEAPLMLESDDLIASMAAQYHGRTIIHSSDKDLRQCLVDDRVLIIKRSYVDEQSHELKVEYFSTKNLRDEFGFEPEQWIDYQCIVGDSSDNLGDLSWRWVGDKLAKQMVQSGDSILGLSVEDERLDKRQRQTLHEFKQSYPLIRQLMTLRTDIRWPFELEHLKALELVR